MAFYFINQCPSNSITHTKKIPYYLKSKAITTLINLEPVVKSSCPLHTEKIELVTV